MFLAVTTATRNFVIICLFLAEDSTLAGLVSLNCERKVPSPNFGPYVSFLTQRRRFLSRLHVIAATASRENSSWLIDLLMSRAKNYVSALDKRPAIHSPLCPPLCSSLSLSLSFFNYRPLVSIQFETIVTTFSRPFSIYRPSPEILSARSFWLLRFFAYPDSRLFHLLYRWIESRFDYTYGYWKSLFFFLLKKFLSSFRAREKVDRFRLPFGKSEVRGGVKISIANDTCACVVWSSGVTFTFFSLYLSFSVFQSLMEKLLSRLATNHRLEYLS